MTQLADAPAAAATAEVVPALRDIPPRRRRRAGVPGNRASAFTYILVVISVAIFGIPFVWVLLTAIATPGQLDRGVPGLLDLSSPAWSNFVDAVTKVDFLAYGANTLF